MPGVRADRYRVPENYRHEELSTVILAYEEFVDFPCGCPSVRSVIDFDPSQAAKDRVGELLQRQKTAALSPDETDELNHYLHIEHVMRLAKARARGRLANT